MFRIEAFVDDKKLGEALRALAGIAIGNPAVQPVVNAEEKDGKVVPSGNGSLPGAFANYVKRHKLGEFGPQEMKKFVKGMGKSESSANYFTKRLKELGLVKKAGGSGPRTRYAVVKQ